MDEQEDKTTKISLKHLKQEYSIIITVLYENYLAIGREE